MFFYLLVDGHFGRDGCGVMVLDWWTVCKDCEGDPAGSGARVHQNAEGVVPQGQGQTGSWRGGKCVLWQSGRLAQAASTLTRAII